MRELTCLQTRASGVAVEGAGRRMPGNRALRESTPKGFTGTRQRASTIAWQSVGHTPELDASDTRRRHEFMICHETGGPRATYPCRQAPILFGARFMRRLHE